MKKKGKNKPLEILIKIVKSRIFAFVSGAVIFSIIGAGAATYFASGDVSYDNSISGLKSTDVQSAIDELYNECSASAGDYILNNVEIVTTGDGLYADEYEEGRYIYKGTKPNNYITFSGETWRIMSVEKDGTIKLIRNEPVERKVWDESISNNWARPATLNTYLNSTYLQTLSQQEKVVSHDWAIGAVTYGNNDLSGQIDAENGNIWNGKVGLMTVSEYLRANSNTSQCKTFSLINTNYSTCKTTNYLVPSSGYLWSLSADSRNSNQIFDFTYTGGIGTASAFGLDSYVPTLYLSSDITLNGEGTEANPYVVE